MRFVAYEQSQSTYNYFWAQRNDFPTATTPELSEGGTAPSDATNGGSSSDNNGNYDYNRRSVISRIAYILCREIPVRRPVACRWIFPFCSRPSMGIFPIYFLQVTVFQKRIGSPKMFSYIDGLKIRASYGVLGDDNITAYQFADNYSFNNAYVLDNGSGAAINPGIDLTKLANPDITWETAKKLDIGIDATFLKGFTLEAIYFSQKRSKHPGLPQRIIARRYRYSKPLLRGAHLCLPRIFGKVNSNGFEGTLGYSHNGKFQMGCFR